MRKSKFLNLKYIILILIVFILLIFFIIGNFFIAPTISNVTITNSVKNDSDKIVNIEVKNYFFKLNKETWCILSFDNNIPDLNDKNWVRASNGYCSIITSRTDYKIYVKDRYGNIENYDNIKDKKIDIKLSKENFYMYIGESQQIKNTTKMTKKIDWSSTNKNVAVVNKDGIIKAKTKGKATIEAKVDNVVYAKANVIVTDLIVKKDVNTKKSYIACKQFSEEESQLLDKILEDKINEAGYKTRAGVVEAARFLTLQFAYRVPYFYENGRLNNYEPYKYVDGEGRYYHKGLYLSVRKFKDIKASFVGPAIWGCDLQNYTDWNGVYVTGKYYPNGLDCSGFVTWSLLNGGFDIGDIGAGDDNLHTDLTDLGDKVYITEELMNSGKVKVGDLIGLNGHMAILSGWDDNNYYIAESLNTTGGVVMSVVPKDKLVNNSIYKYIILMDKVYQNDGNLTTMW